ncbi:AMP-binding protein [Amycolatopsis sp. GM8]|uniref:AMP-binding protein n=1 Tax=Amycolatopsis sp. GM8 TaxID=2896530 RepID=UPI001F323144|nr:AMP-binding protein [Amycolatopsis sp. GM8]
MKPPVDTIPGVLARAVAAVPDKVFLDFEGKTLTYRAFDVLSNRYAHGLAAMGVRAGRPVALMLDNSAEAILFWFAANKLGAISVPVNTAFKGSFLSGQIADCGAEILLIEDDYADRLPEIRADMPALRQVVTRGEFARLLSDRDTAPEATIDPSETALIVYTSGTTGPSKGCMICHNHVCTMGWYSFFSRGVREDDVLWTCLPLFHMSALGMTVLSALVAHATASIVPRFSVSRFWPEIERSGATEVNMLGSLAQLIAQAPDSAEARRCSGQLRRIVAAPYPAALARIWEDRFGIPAKPTSGYGMTECVIATQAPDDPPAPPGSCGRSGLFFDIMIVDDHDRELPCGEVGEIVCRPLHPHIMFKGYWNKPEATVAAWRNLWFHTGDLGRMDERGYLYFVDRKKDYLRRRGENISSLELEAVFRTHPAIRDVAVHAVFSPLGEDEVKITAELKEPGLIDEETLCRWSAARLPYFAVPLYIEFREELPRTPTGKVQKGLLRDEGRTATTWCREDAGFVLEKR